MLRSRFLWQLGASFGAAVVISTLVFGFVTSSQVQRDARENIRESLRVQASLLRHQFVPWLVKDEPISSGALIEMTRGTPHRITIIDDRGVVLADNREDPAVMDNHADRPEILRAKSHGIGASERYSNTLEQNMSYVALPVRQGEELVGYVRVAVPLDRVEGQLADLRNRIFASAALIGGLCLVLVIYLARRFTKPVADMTNVATRLARGEYHLRLSVGRNDELGHLSAALNELAEGTEERIDALIHGRNQLAAVLSGLSEGVIAVDPNQRIVHINDSARNILNLGARDLIGVPLWEVVRISEITRAVDTCQHELINVNSVAHIDGKTLDVSAVLLRDEEWTASAGAIVVLQDITEMLHLEKVRSDFVANASHELRTPISAIRGLVETILDDRNMKPAVVNRFVDRISSQAKRLDAIVQDLIHLSRFDDYTRRMAASRIDLCHLLNQVYRAKKDDAVEIGIDFELDLPEKPIEVEGEQQALDQMVTNLVDNAFKYTGKDGRVQLRLRRLGSMALIDVEDDGIGISIADQQRIFERFYRVDKGRSRELGGTGLGLSIVKHIAQSHHGSVTVESRPGKGSVFSVRIPMADASISKHGAA